MDIKAKDIESVEVIGELNGQEVKVLKTYGGFHMAVGLKKKQQKNAEVLAAGSHPALLSYQLTKEYSDLFKPKMCKSEQEQPPVVTEVTDQLSDNLEIMGFEAFILQKNHELDFVVSRFGLDVIHYHVNISEQIVEMDTRKISPIAKSHPELAKDLSKIMSGKFKEMNIKIESDDSQNKE